jgi:hypothetical protein
VANFRRKTSSSLHQAFLSISLKMAGSQLKRLVSTCHFKELVKQVAIAILKLFLELQMIVYEF